MKTTRPGERPMTLRLVLVSLVAAMGLTIPSAPVIESWVASTQNWMNARFADWDTRNPQTADYVIVRDFFQQAGIASRHPVRRGATGVFRAEEAVIRADPGWREAQPGHRLRTQSQERGDRRGAATGGPETGRGRSVRPHPRSQKRLSRGPARAGSVEQDVGFRAPAGGLSGILTPAIRADRRGQQSPWRRR